MAKERKRFYEISRGSLVELDNLLEVSIELQYCLKERLLEIDKINNELFAKLSRLIEKTLDNLGVFTVVFMKGIPGLKNSYNDHKIIINGVLENDCEKAVSGLKDHINRVKNKIIEIR